MDIITLLQTASERADRTVTVREVINVSNLRVADMRYACNLKGKTGNTTNL